MAEIESGRIYDGLDYVVNKENLDQLNLYFFKLFLALSVLTFEQSEKASEEPFFEQSEKASEEPFFEQSEKARREDNLFLK